MIDKDRKACPTLSKLAVRALCVLIPILTLAGFAIWVQGTASFTPDFLEKHGFKFEGTFVVADGEKLVYVARVPLAAVEAHFVKEMTGRGFVVDVEQGEGLLMVRVSNGGIPLGYLEGGVADTGPYVYFHQFTSHNFLQRIRLATGWQFLP